MGKYFDLTLQLPQYHPGVARERRKESLRRESASTDNSTSLQLQPWHGIVAAAAVVLAIFYYLILANSGATASYQVTNMQSKMSDMIQQQKKLETERAELQSMQTIQSNPQVAAMVPVTSVTYLGQ